MSFWLCPTARTFSGKRVIQKALAERMLNAEVIYHLTQGQLSLECFQIPRYLKAALDLCLSHFLDANRYLLCLKMLKPQLRHIRNGNSKKTVLTDAAKLGIPAPRSCGKLFSPVFNGLARN